MKNCSNLGSYQVMTTLAKKVGGPENLLFLIFSASCVTCELINFLVLAVSNAIKNANQDTKIIRVISKNNNGVEVVVRYKCKVSKSNGKYILIEKIDEKN